MKVILVCNLSITFGTPKMKLMFCMQFPLTLSVKRFSTYLSIHSTDALFFLGYTVTSCGNGWNETAQKCTACKIYCSLQILYSVMCQKLFEDVDFKNTIDHSSLVLLCMYNLLCTTFLHNLLSTVWDLFSSLLLIMNKKWVWFRWGDLP